MAGLEHLDLLRHPLDLAPLRLGDRHTGPAVTCLAHAPQLLIQVADELLEPAQLRATSTQQEAPFHQLTSRAGLVQELLGRLHGALCGHQPVLGGRQRGLHRLALCGEVGEPLLMTRDDVGQVRQPLEPLPAAPVRVPRRLGGLPGATQPGRRPFLRRHDLRDLRGGVLLRAQMGLGGGDLFGGASRGVPGPLLAAEQVLDLDHPPVRLGHLGLGQVVGLDGGAVVAGGATGAPGEVSEVLLLHEPQHLLSVTVVQVGVGGAVQGLLQDTAGHERRQRPVVGLGQAQRGPQGGVEMGDELLEAGLGGRPGQLLGTLAEDLELGTRAAQPLLGEPHPDAADGELGLHERTHVAPDGLQGLRPRAAGRGLEVEQPVEGLQQGRLADLVGALHHDHAAVGQLDRALGDPAHVPQGDPVQPHDLLLLSR